MLPPAPRSTLFPYTTLFRSRGEHAENLERAIALLEAALQVRTREAFPAECRSTTLLLAEQLAHLGRWAVAAEAFRSEEHTSELQSHVNLVCRLLLEKKKLDK